MNFVENLRGKLNKTSPPPEATATVSAQRGPTLPLARSTAEAHIYMFMNPCACGENDSSKLAVTLTAEDFSGRWEGSCPKCGALRRFVFRLPEDISLFRRGATDFGPGGPSELLDPGEWLLVADRFAARIAPAQVAPGTEAARSARNVLGMTIAAINEVLAFIPAGKDAVPPQAFRTEGGRNVYNQEPGRFRQDRLEFNRDAYREILTEMGG